MTRNWKFVAVLAGAMALAVRGVAFFTYQGEPQAVPNMSRYYSKILPSEDVAQQKLSDYRGQIEQAGGTIKLVMLGMETSSFTTRVSASGPEQSTKAMTSQRGPALLITLPEGTDIGTLLPAAHDLAFRRVS